MLLLYIDPGTGSMLFTILMGVVGAAIYALRMLIIKLRYRISGGKAEVSTIKTPFVIYSDDKRYWNVFEPICKEFHNRGVEVLYLTGSKDDPVFQCGLDNIKGEFIGKDNKAFMRLNFLNAGIVLSTTPGLEVYQWKRSKNVLFYVHIPHAANDITLYRMFGIDYYDAVLLSGEYQVQQIRALEKLRNLPAKELVKVGSPYMDDLAVRFQERREETEHPCTVLLAPSWGKGAILNVYGGKIIEQLLQTGYHIIIRPHPQSFESEKELMNKLMEQYPETEQLEWNRDRDNFDVLCRSDVLISDFSGVVLDFALIQHKPVIYTKPDFDLSAYDAWWLEEPLWILSALERIGHQLTEDNMQDVKMLIDACMQDGDFEEECMRVCEETWEYYGEGAKRTVDYLLEKYERDVR